MSTTLEEKITIPNGAYTYVVGTKSKNIILYSLYGIKVLIPNKKTVIIQGTDPIKVRNVKMEILSNIGNKYSMFEHPGKITNFLVYEKQMPIQFKKYKTGIQDKYRLVYSNKQIPQVVKSSEVMNDWDIFSRDKLLIALARNKDIPYEVTIGRNTFYSSNKTKDIKGIEDQLYYLGNLKTMSVGYKRDIKIKWDPIVTDAQTKYITNKLNSDDIIKQYSKTGSVIVDIISGKRSHCSVQLLDDVPIPTTFKSNIEKPIKETIVIGRLDMFPDIRYKFSVNSNKVSDIKYDDIIFNEDMTMDVKNKERYHIAYSYIKHIVKYNVNGITIKIIHDIFNDGNVIKFTTKTLEPIQILDYINLMFKN